METVKIVFDVDSKDIKSTTDELKALNKVTNDEVAAMERLSNSASDAGDGFVSLRTRVKEAKEEAVKAAEKYGEFSTQALEAKKKAGQLADQMGDLNRQVNLLNPEAKAKAFSNLAQGVVGAFSVATGALQAFGVKNKEVEALAMKLQGALNITQGIASIGQLKESFADLQVILGFTTATQKGLTAAQKEQAIASAQAALGTGTLTAAQEAEALAAAEAELANKSFTASLLTNPIFLVVAAIGALAAAYMSLNEETKSAILNEEELKKAKEKTTELKNKELQLEIDLKVANKEISKQKGEIEKIEAKRVEDTTELIKRLADLDKEEKKNLETIKEKTKQGEILSKSTRESAALGAAKAFQEVADAKAANAQILKSRQALQTQLSLINKNAGIETSLQKIDEANENKKTNDKIADDNKQAAEKRKKERADAEKKLWEELDAIINEGSDQEIARLKEKNDIRKKAEKDLADEIIRFRRLAVKGDNVKEVQLEMDLLDEKYAADLFNLERTAKSDEEYQTQKAALDKKYANDQTELNNKTTDIAIANNEKEANSNKQKNDQILANEKKTQQARKEYLQGGVDALRFITQTTSEADAAAREEEMAQLEDQKNKKIISEEEYQKRMKVIKQKQAEDNKKAAIFQASLDLASALINALTYKPANTVPVAVVFAAAIAAANLAKIAATPIPKFQKGTLAVPGVDMGRDSVHAMLQPGEAVIPVSTNRAYHPTIKAIYEKKISPSEINSFVMSRTSAGGKQSITANVDPYALGRALGKNKGVQIENAQVVGKVIANELNNYNVRRGW